MQRLLKSISFVVVAAALMFATSLPAIAEPFPARELQKLPSEEIQRVNQVVIRLHFSGIYDDTGWSRDSARYVDAALKLASAAPPGKVRDWLLNKTLNKLAHSYAAGDEAALRRFDDAVRGAEAIQDPALRAHFCAKLGEKRFSSGERERGSELLIQAVAFARQVEEPIARASSFASVGRELANVGMKKQAISLTEEGLKLLETCENGPEKLAVHAELAANFVAVGTQDEALRMLRQVSSPQDTTLFDAERSSLLVFLSDQFATVGEKREALDKLDMAVKQTEGCVAPKPGEVRFYEHDYRLQTSLRPCKVLVEIAGGYAGLQEWDRAQAVIEKIEDQRYRAMAMCKVAVALHGSGKEAAAYELLERATALGEKAAHPLLKIEILVNVAKTRIKMKRFVERIADLLTALEKQLDRSVQTNPKTENEE